MEKSLEEKTLEFDFFSLVVKYAYQECIKQFSTFKGITSIIYLEIYL